MLLQDIGVLILFALQLNDHIILLNSVLTNSPLLLNMICSYRGFGHLNQAVLRDSGHIVEFHQPHTLRELVTRFIERRTIV